MLWRRLFRLTKSSTRKKIEKQIQLGINSENKNYFLNQPVVVAVVDHVNLLGEPIGEQPAVA